MTPILISLASNPANQDRGCVIQEKDRTVFCVADGAGGVGGGAEAAEKAVEMVRQNTAALDCAQSCLGLLNKMDVEIGKDLVAGETTCTLTIVTSDEIFGASVGDSGAWFIPEAGAHLDLTLGQQRKPLIGSGAAVPFPFRFVAAGGFLLLATDGLLKYTSAQRIVDKCRQDHSDMAARHLIELVRYKSGALPDDVTIILTGLGKVAYE